MAGREVRVGLIGAGMAGRTHAFGYRSLGWAYPETRVRLVTVADADQGLAERVGRQFEFERWTADWSAVADDPNIDAVSVAVPNHEHQPIVERLLAAGKHVLCEKPLAPTPVVAWELVQAAERAGVVAGVGFNCRFMASIGAIRDLIADGRLGRIRQFSGRYLTDYAASPETPYSWRYDRSLAGGGAIVDIGAHAVDTARYLVGDLASVDGAVLETFITERWLPAARATGHALVELSSETRTVDTDDVATLSLRSVSGAVCQLTVNRVATGYRNSLAFDVVGEDGSASFDSERSAEFWLYDGEGERATQGFKRVVAGVSHPYLADVLPMAADGVGHGLAETFIAQCHAFLEAVATGRSGSLGTFRDGYAAALTCHAAQLASEQHGSVDISSGRPLGAA